MDVDQKIEGNQQDSTPETESCASEAAPEDASQKRKRTEDEDSEENLNAKKMKVDNKEEKAVSDGGEDNSKKEDTAAEIEEDKDKTSEEKLAAVEEKELISEEKELKSEEKETVADKKEVTLEEKQVTLEEKKVTVEEKEVTSKEKEPVSEEKQTCEEKQASVAEEEGKAEGGEDKTLCEAAKQIKKEEPMEVEESAVKMEVTDGQGNNPRTSLPEVKRESKEQEDAQTKQSKEIKLEPKLETESEVKTEKPEVVQRRYPTRSRRVEEKGASQPVKISSSVSEEKKQGNLSRDMESESTRAASVKSDSGSDKENLNSDSVVDLSNAGTPDVILLSEEEETEEGKEKKAKRRKLVRRLQAHLRNEEAKLVLLKKLRQSQLTPQVQDHTSTPTTTTTNSQLTKQTVPRQQGGPPPLVRGNQQVRASNLHMQQQQNRTPTQGQIRSMQGPPPLVVTPRMGSSTANGHGNQNLRNNTTPHANQHSSSSLRPSQQQQSLQHQQQSAQHQQAATPPQPPVDTQTPAQRQAAAKLALRKQLEKTLLQIPPPKPPAPEMNFIPSLACPDFVLLLGLEEVVNHIIDLQLIARGQKSPDEKFICNPFTCVQCGTDYTPVWKREKPGSKNVICEHCVTWNQKRALKQEHTNRLKSAFVKALQQEQEIERMQAQTPSNPSTPTPSGTPPTSSSAPPQALAAAAAASNVAAAAAMTMSPASFRPSAEQVRHHHSFLQAQAQLRAGQPLTGLQGFGTRSPFYNLPYVKQADLQRQYLLDMIPRAAGMPWKQ